MSPLKFDISKEMIRIFINNISASFSCIIMDKSELDFKTFFNNDLYKVYKSFSTILLRNNIDSRGNEICMVVADDYFYPDGVNLELATRAIINDHYKRLVVSSFLQVNSKSTDLLQLTDLLLGAVIYDLKLTEKLIKPYSNLKFKALDFLHNEVGAKNSFFLDSYGNKKDRFIIDKFKVSIFKPSQNKKTADGAVPQNTN